MKHKLRIWNERVLRRVVVEIDVRKKYPEDGAIAEFHIVKGVQSRAEAMKRALELVRILSPESCQNLRVISTVTSMKPIVHYMPAGLPFILCNATKPHPTKTHTTPAAVLVTCKKCKKCLRRAKFRPGRLEESLTNTH